MLFLFGLDLFPPLGIVMYYPKRNYQWESPGIAHGEATFELPCSDSQIYTERARGWLEPGAG